LHRPHGFDGGKLIKARSVTSSSIRWVSCSTRWSRPADVQDRDGGLMVLSTLFGQFPFLKKLFADSAYAGPVFQDGLASVMPDSPSRSSAVRSGQRLRRSAQTLDRRTNHRLARPLSQARQGLGKSQLERPRFPRLASIRLMLRNSAILHKVPDGL